MNTNSNTISLNSFF
jgi:hypothetical protein